MGERETDGVRDKRNIREREDKKSRSQYIQSEILLFLRLIMYE